VLYESNNEQKKARKAKEGWWIMNYELFYL
jgi:hypothetical protein